MLASASSGRQLFPARQSFLRQSQLILMSAMQFGLDRLDSRVQSLRFVAEALDPDTLGSRRNQVNCRFA